MNRNNRRKTTKPLKGRAAIQHLAVDSPQHENDVKKGKERQKQLEASGGIVSITLPFNKRVTRTYVNAPKGFAYIEGKTEPVDWREFYRFIEEQERLRVRYKATMKDKSKKSCQRTVSRKIANPKASHMQSCHPVFADVLELLCLDGKPDLATKLLLRWSNLNGNLFRNLSECDLLGRTIHWDTNIPHTDLIHSRYSVDGRILLPYGLGVAGPFAVGADRLYVWEAKKSI